ncbi:MAG TPA: DNA-3-methyladenine glycosylase [Bacteroidota bacterium]|nr:DNA-3-methyladenine glycosylase [Bacteroidota bacterium]
MTKSSLHKLRRSFYLRHTLQVAKELLGCLLVRRIGRKLLIGRIVEVEAYLGEKDPASHAYRGETPRNSVMFREGGLLYVYFTYGMHYCSNVVTEAKGIPRAVLLRAVEPVAGIDTMRTLRGFDDTNDKNLTNGPAKLCKAMGIERPENGTDLLGNEIYITKGDPVPRSRILSSTRIGINVGKEKKWRFYIKGNPFVSR